MRENIVINLIRNVDSITNAILCNANGLILSYVRRNMTGIIARNVRINVFDNIWLIVYNKKVSNKELEQAYDKVIV